MKWRTPSFSWLGVGALLVFLVCVGRNPDTYATEIEYGDDFDAWSWIGVPVDQNALTGQGGANESAIGFIHLNCKSNNTCDAANSNNYPRVDIELNTIDSVSGKAEVNGWGWLGSASGESNCTVDADGHAFCSGPPSIPQSIGWLNFDPAPLPDGSAYGDTVNCPAGSVYPAPPCYSAKIDPANKEEISGWARLETLATYGDQLLGTSNKNNDWGWVLLRGKNTQDQKEFGVLYRNGTLEGWAWSAGGSIPGKPSATDAEQNASGLGWIDFSAGLYSTGGFVSTKQGDVYAQDGVINPNNTPQPNATFLLFGDTPNAAQSEFINFSTSLGANGTLGMYGALELPDAPNQYRSQLGRLDLPKLTTVVEDSNNIYGNEVVNVTSVASLAGNRFLNGQVIVVDNGNPTTTYTMSSATTFMNGTAQSSTGQNYDGSGVIIVNGDLQIDSNIFYEQSALVDQRNLASVVWIIKGNLTIGASVSNLVGAFFVIGDSSGNKGQVTTLPSSSAQLVTYGLMMARSFNLQRTYAGPYGNPEPAELFYYDGRILVNTPPGLRDYTSTLPRIEQK